MFSPLLHHVELAKLARHVYNYLQLRKKSPSTLCQFLQQLDTSEQNFIAKIDCLSASFVDGINRAQCEPEWVAGQRAHYLCTINYMRLTFCRVLLEPRLSQLEIWSEIHTHAMTAAFNIVHIANVPLVYRMMWYVDLQIITNYTS